MENFFATYILNAEVKDEIGKSKSIDSEIIRND